MELGSCGAQRQVRLRSQQQHQQGSLIPQVTEQQAQSHLDRDKRGGHRGGQLKHQRGQERHPQHGHGGCPVRVGDLPDHFFLRFRAAEHLEGGQALHDVKEVPGESCQQPPLAPRLGLGVPAHKHGEHRDDRQRNGDDHRGNPVCRRYPRQYGDRHHDGQHQLRKITSKIGI